MLNKIISASLANRLTVLILAVVITLAGCVVLLRTEVDIFPDLNAPTVVVMTEAGGMAPEEVERVVTFPIETAVNGAPGVTRVRSASATGFSMVAVEFDWGTDVYRARQTIAEKLQEASMNFPQGVGQPVIGPQSSILGEMLIVALTADSTSMLQLRTIADMTVRRRLLSLGGVSQVTVIGGDVAEYSIALNAGKMKLYGLTLNDVKEALTQANDNASGGIVNDHGSEYVVKADISTTSPDDIELLTVGFSPTGDYIRLGDIATVRKGARRPVIGLASENTRPAVLLTVTKQPGVGTIELTERVEKELDELRAQIPADIRISTDIFRQSDFIERSINNLQQSLFEGMIFVIVILFFFLMNLRTTIISVIALPVSIIVSVIILHFLGFTINTMSLGGIAIAIGSLVDDAIVDVENVYKRLLQNASLPEAERQPKLKVVYEASKEVRMPIFNSSLIIIAGFLPLFFLQGIEGRLLIPLGVSFIVALAASTVVALTLTPVLCSYLLTMRRKDSTELGKEPWLSRRLAEGYVKGLAWAMSHVKTVLTVTGVLLAGALAVFLTLGRSFLPSFNEGSFTINVSALPGISIEESDRIGREAEKIILSVPEIKTVGRKTGRAELDEHSLGSNVSELEAPYELKGRSRNEVARDLRDRLSTLAGANIEIGQPISHRIDAMLSGTEAQVAIKVFGNDLNTLHAIGRNIQKVIGAVPGTVDVNMEQQIGRPQIDIKPRRGVMAGYGVTMNSMRELIDVALGGVKVSQVYEDGYVYDLTLRYEQPADNALTALPDMLIDTNRGKVPLSELADIVSTTGPNTINRENTRRRIVVSANIDGRDLRGAVNDLRKAVEQNVQMPDGYYVTFGGQFESEARASRTLLATSLLSLLIIFMLLYHEFKSVKESLVILINMPLALIGSAFILWLTGGELNIPAIIGIISLLGISTRNGMLLMSRYNHLAASGVGLDQRIATGSRERLLPIIMTALTSALALIPIALRSGQPGNELQAPMAIVILGGLISATALNIFVVPILYRYIARDLPKK